MFIDGCISGADKAALGLVLAGLVQGFSPSRGCLSSPCSPGCAEFLGSSLGSPHRVGRASSISPRQRDLPEHSPHPGTALLPILCSLPEKYHLLAVERL